MISVESIRSSIATARERRQLRTDEVLSDGRFHFRVFDSVETDPILELWFDPSTNWFEFQIGRYGLYEGDYDKFQNEKALVDALVACAAEGRFVEIERWLPLRRFGALVAATTKADLGSFGTFETHRSFNPLSILGGQRVRRGRRPPGVE